MSTEKPNILLFFTDQQRWDTVGSYGCPLDLTPNLDALASEGVRFENAFTPQPVCGPARSCIQTGLYATQTGVFVNSGPFNPNLRTLGNHLGEAGYDLGYIGKWHLATTGKEPIPHEQRWGWNGTWEAADLLEFTSHPWEGRLFDSDMAPIEWKDRYRTDFLTERAIRFLQRDRGKDPFFLMVSYLEPHHQNDWNRFAAPDEYAFAIRNHPRGPWIPEDLRGFPGEWYEQLPDYLGMVKKLDENLGRIVHELDRTGVRENTLIVFLSDHGCHFRTRNEEYKRSAHDASIRIPLVMNGPGFRGGRIARGLASLIDVAPTLLESAGIPVPEEIRGRSLVPLAGSNSGNWREDVLVQISESMVARAVRTHRFTYCVYAPDRHRTRDSGADVYVEYQLYDNEMDPHQKVNLIGRSSFRATADDLKARLIRLMKEAGEEEPEIINARFFA